MVAQKPKLVNFHESEWVFVFPPSIDNEETYNEYYEGVELLDYNDVKYMIRLLLTVVQHHLSFSYQVVLMLI